MIFLVIFLYIIYLLTYKNKILKLNINIFLIILL